MSEVFKLDDVELMWPFLYERNKLSGKYQVDLVNLSDDQVELIEKTGVSVRQKEDKDSISLVSLRTMRSHLMIRMVTSLRPISKWVTAVRQLLCLSHTHGSRPLVHQECQWVFLSW